MIVETSIYDYKWNKKDCVLWAWSSRIGFNPLNVERINIKGKNHSLFVDKGRLLQYHEAGKIWVDQFIVDLDVVTYAKAFWYYKGMLLDNTWHVCLFQP